MGKLRRVLLLLHSDDSRTQQIGIALAIAPSTANEIASYPILNNKAPRLARVNATYSSFRWVSVSSGLPR